MKENAVKLIYIRASKSKGYLALGFLDEEKNKYSLTVSEADYRRIGSHLIGDGISDFEFDSYKKSDELYRAKRKALSILSYGDNSEKMLRIKLLRSGFSGEISASVTEEMKNLGYINAERQLQRLVESLVNIHNIGPLKLFPKLIAKGYKKSDIQNAIDELTYSGAIDFSRSAERLIEKKLPEGASEEEKKQLLYKNGYSVC